MAVRTIEDPGELGALETAWALLAAEHGTIATQDPAWALGAARGVAAGERLRVVVVEDGARLVAVAPLLLRSGRLELLGYTELFEPTDLLAASPAALACLCEGLAGLHRPLRLERLPAGSATPAALRAALGPRGRTIVRAAEPWPALTLGERWTELGGGLGARRRSDLRRAMRRAQAEGDVRTRLLRPGPRDVPALLDEAFAVEARSWKGREGTALVDQPERAAFLRAFAESAAARGELCVSFLDVGDRTAAMQVAAEWRRSLWLLKIGYDEAFSRCSPGLLLLAHVVRDAARRGLDTLELLGATEEWLEPWSSDVRDAVTVLAYPLHPLAAPATARDAAHIAHRGARRLARNTARGAARTAARATSRVVEQRHLAGPELVDALRIAADRRSRGLATTIGYWNRSDDSVASVRARYEAQISALAGVPDAQISIKAPAIGDDLKIVEALLRGAAEARVGVHLDAHAEETQPAALDIACALAGTDGVDLGCTLTGRWPRSVADAERVAAHGLRVRVVKSEWPSEDDPDRDPRAGYLEVVDALVAARAAYVAVATHDAPLAGRSLAALRAAGVPCELQVLHGMRARRAIRQALDADVPVRVYVPYGVSGLPYSLDRAFRDPRSAVRLAHERIRRSRPL